MLLRQYLSSRNTSQTQMESFSGTHPLATCPPGPLIETFELSVALSALPWNPLPLILRASPISIPISYNSMGSASLFTLVLVTSNNQRGAKEQLRIKHTRFTGDIHKDHAGDSSEMYIRLHPKTN